MISFGHTRIFLCRQPTDMRKSFNGLAAVIANYFPEAELEGSLFVFMNRRQTQIKAFYWDGDGHVIWAKRLRKGCFRKLDGDSKSISRRELVMLLEGIAPKRLNKRFNAAK